jgi:hypothetical protein
LEVIVKRLLISFLLILLWQQAAHATPSARQTGFVLLQEGVGARAAGMGEAYTAVVGDQTSAFWNPAGVAALQGKDFVLMHHSSFQGIKQGYGGWAYGNEKRGLALSLNICGVGGLEGRTGPTADPLGTFSLYDLDAGMSYAQRFGQRVYVGFNIRALYETIGPESAWGTGVDIGLLYRLPLNGLTLGAAYRNLGRMQPLDQARIPLPRIFRVGTAYTRGAWAGAVDVRLPETGAKGIHFGLEYAVKRQLFLRGGYQTGHDTRDLSFGLGLVRKNWRIDYAFVPTHMGLGSSHRMAVGIR